MRAEVKKKVPEMTWGSCAGARLTSQAKFVCTADALDNQAEQELAFGRQVATSLASFLQVQQALPPLQVTPWVEGANFSFLVHSLVAFVRVVLSFTISGACFHASP